MASSSAARVARGTLLAALVATVPLPAAAEQNFYLGAGVDFSTWNLLGDARSSSNPIVRELILTDAGSGDSKGAGFAPTSVLIDFNQPFTFSFQWLVYAASPNDTRGDGMTFFLTSVSKPAIGGGGSDLGYGGSGLSGYAIAFDTFNFEDEPMSPSLQILRDGSNTPLAATETGLGDGIRVAFTWTATMSYTPSGLDDEQGVLTGTLYNGHPSIQRSFEVSTEADWSGYGVAEFDDGGNYLGRSMYYGFTAANGAATDGHLVSSLTPVPEPETWAMVVVGLGLVGWRLRKRAARY